MTTAGSAIKLATPALEEVAKRALTRPTTIVGAIIGGGPALYRLATNGYNKNDLITVGIAAGALILEITPASTVVNVASALWSLGSVAWDAYTMTHPENP